MSSQDAAFIPAHDCEDPIATDAHARFIRQLYHVERDSLEYQLTSHLRLHAIYWAVISLYCLDLLDSPTQIILPRQQVIDEVLLCRDHTQGGFGAAPGHDAHIVPTLHAIQILQIYNALDDALPSAEQDRVVSYICSLQDPADGAIKGDIWGEKEMRLNYAATQALVLLQRSHTLDIPAVRAWVAQCRNIDGGYGGVPQGESHGAHCFTALGTLTMITLLDNNAHPRATPTGLSHTEQYATAAWLSQRQTPSGGLNGRPQKLEDVCYSWWVIAALAMTGRNNVSWIDGHALTHFILAAQDTQDGGFADRPGDEPDINHTCFALAGLGLLGKHKIRSVDPRFCMPKEVITRLGHEHVH
ncbi:hypothetical protein PYCC9005_005335 [Savitreella phatthalungensis]